MSDLRLYRGSRVPRLGCTQYEATAGSTCGWQRVGVPREPLGLTLDR